MEKIYGCGKMLVVLTLLLSATACREEGNRELIVLDIPAIAHKTTEQVQAILGEPDSGYFQKRGQKKVAVQLYQPHHIEIYYLAGKTTEILVNEPAPLPYHQASLASFNIAPQNPDQANDNAAIKWSNVRGFKHITFFSHNIQADTVNAFRM